MAASSIRRLFKEDINIFLPLVHELMGNTVNDTVLKQRFEAMFEQHYECHGIYSDDMLAGVFGLWFATRHYCGKTCEPDHVFILPQYRRGGLGKDVFDWIFNYARDKGCVTSELNSYVSNYPSHKFYLNADYEILGYHFLKKL